MRRTLQYVACDCCGGNPGEPCDTMAESRKASGYTHFLALDFCYHCEFNRHAEPCEQWMRDRLRWEKRAIQESWQKRAEAVQV